MLGAARARTRPTRGTQRAERGVFFASRSTASPNTSSPTASCTFRRGVDGDGQRRNKEGAKK